MPANTDGFKLNRFKVEGLFGRHTLELPFRDNRLIIVGENGSGKSTIVNLLYFALTSQWGKLRGMPFSRLEVELDGTVVSIERDKLLETSMDPDARRRLETELRLRFSERHAESLLTELMSIDVDDAPSRDRLMLMAERTGVPMRLLADLIRSQTSLSLRSTDDAVTNAAKEIEARVPHQVLFLPTYRRIERDLQALFPNVPVERELRRWSRSRNPRRAGGYLELVEFGMQDVEEAFKETTQRLDREFRAELNNLTGEYLRDIIRSEYRAAAPEPVIAPEVPSIVADILGRMDDKTLPQKERRELQGLIAAVQQGGRTIGDHERVVLHFVSKLIRIHEEQRRREDRVTKLVAVCNRYLTDKELRFDPKQFDLALVRSSRASPEDIIPASGLSSGEKQIVSLFTHIYLSDASGYIVIIDEPELSISVPWQRKFLEDIVNSGLCHGLIAVTHSPFIFENSLSGYARSMVEFLQPSGTP